jgi:hypothetical protein
MTGCCPGLGQRYVLYGEGEHRGVVEVEGSDFDHLEVRGDAASDQE